MLGKIVRFVFGALWNRVVLWWTKRQLAQAQVAHQLAVQRLESLQTGVHTEGVIQVAGVQVVQDAAKLTTIQQQLDELLRRANERANQGETL